MLLGTSHQKHLRLDGYCVTEGPRWLPSSSQGQTGRRTFQVQSVPEREKLAFRYCISCPHRKHRRGWGGHDDTLSKNVLTALRSDWSISNW